MTLSGGIPVIWLAAGQPTLAGMALPSQLATVVIAGAVSASFAVVPELWATNPLPLLDASARDDLGGDPLGALMTGAVAWLTWRVFTAIVDPCLPADRNAMRDDEGGSTPLTRLQPLTSQRILRMEENALIIRAKFMCKPREQFVLRRVAYQRIEAACADVGIDFAPRTARVLGPGSRAGGTEKAAAPAALASVAGAPG